jgi:hypothetical protein
MAERGCHRLNVAAASAAANLSARNFFQNLTIVRDEFDLQRHLPRRVR